MRYRNWEFHRDPPVVVALANFGVNPIAEAVTTAPPQPTPEVNKLGLSLLGICHPKWPCEETVRAFRGVEVLRFGWLAHTFGERCPCAERLLQDSRPKQVRVHIANGPCLRNRRCGPYEPFAGETVSSASRKVEQRDPVLMGKFREIMKRTAAQLKRARGGPVECYVSPCLECDLSDPARKALLAMAGEHFPQCKLVDSVFRPRCLRGVVCERHGSKATLRRPCIADTDGEPAAKIDVRAYAKRYRACEAAHLWDFKFNLLDHHSPVFQDPRARTTAPNAAYFEQFARYLRPGGLASPAPQAVNPGDLTGCTARLGFGGGFVWKQSDSHLGIALVVPRGERPAGGYTLIRDGKVLARLTYAAEMRGDPQGRGIYRSSTQQAALVPVSNAVLKSSAGCRVLPEPGYRIEG